MSFILDALKKSEADRQQQSGAEFSDVPSGSGDPQPFKWLWILAVILLVNLAVLLGILFRPGGGERPAAPAQPDRIEQQEAAPVKGRPTFEERVAEARSSQPDAPATEAPAGDATAVEPPAAEQAGSEPPATSPEPARSYLKTIDELRLDGALQIPELHIDIHVYADEPAERFVFINMTKHTEKSRLPEGPVVREITTDGVVLEYEGMVFLLPRE